MRILPPFLHLSPLAVAYSPSSGRGIYEAVALHSYVQRKTVPVANQQLLPNHGGKKSLVYFQDIKLN